MRQPHIAPLVMPAAPPAPMNLPAIDVGFTPENTVLVNKDTGSTRIELPDGSVMISFGSQPRERKSGAKFDDNLAEDMDESELSVISEELLRGIDEDERSRKEWEDTFNRGIDLLGLRLEEPSSSVSDQGCVSKVYHPLLLESVVRYQATSSAELLPAAGPVKVRDDDPQADEARVALAEAFEKDFNHYFTVVAKEYYPDTRRLLFGQGFCGNGFKKIFRCPLRKRPVSDYVSAKDLIVSNDVVSLTNASRVTHRTEMRHATMRRLQLNGYYRDIDLGQPVTQPTETERKIKQVEGLSPQRNIPSDHPYTLYESYVDYDLMGFEHEKGGKPTGLPLPYRITVDKDSRKILEIRRNWREDDEDYMPRQRFVKYGYIPGLGFYDYGLVHLLGNTSRALTAIERQLIDAGQYSNFPGVLLSDVGGRQETTQIRVPPGGAHVIKTGGMAIGQVVMALPYKEPSSVLVNIAKAVEDNGRRLGGTAEVQVGEGRADVPVGTTIALIEQSTKIMGAVHKMNHEAQQQEFELLRELFAEEPQALWKFAKRPKRKWEMAEEFNDLELVPASDPNIPSHIHRVMQATALSQLINIFGQELNRRSVVTIVLTTLGYNPAALLNPPVPPGAAPSAPPPDPAKMAKVAVDAQKQQREETATMIDTTLRIAEKKAELADSDAERASREKIQAMKVEEQRIHSGLTRRAAEATKAGMQHNSELDRQHRERMQARDIVSDHALADKQAQTDKSVADDGGDVV